MKKKTGKKRGKKKVVRKKYSFRRARAALPAPLQAGEGGASWHTDGTAMRRPRFASRAASGDTAGRHANTVKKKENAGGRAAAAPAASGGRCVPLQAIVKRARRRRGRRAARQALAGPVSKRSKPYGFGPES